MEHITDDNKQMGSFEKFSTEDLQNSAMGSTPIDISKWDDFKARLAAELVYIHSDEKLNKFLNQLLMMHLYTREQIVDIARMFNKRNHQINPK